MGAAGVNTIATLLIAFARPTLLGLLYPRDDIREGGIPQYRTAREPGLPELPDRAGAGAPCRIFSRWKHFRGAHIVRTIVRTVASGAVSVAFIWVIARIFTAKLPVRI